MIEPKEIKLTDAKGVERTYYVSKFPAVQGREIILKYPLSGMPKLGDYKVNEETMLKLMSFVGVQLEGKPEPLMLNSVALINNHVPGATTLMRLEWAALEYNVDFFGSGEASTFLEAITAKAQQWITQTVIPSLAQSLEKSSPRSTS